MRAQRLPGGIDVARPEEGAVTLHARVPVAVERERPLIGPVELRALPIHPVPREP